MSSEEMKIRSELEMDVERDLEEEIKEGIYHLALKLHRLYQHQKERNSNLSSSSSSSSDRHVQNQKKSKLLSEININIKVDGGTTIQINEIKKMAGEKLMNPAEHKRSPSVQGKMSTSTRRPKFDWEKSLRSGSSPLNVISNAIVPNGPAMLELGWKY